MTNFQEHLKMQNFKQTIQQKLLPQQIHLMKLIELPTLAFESRIFQEIEENPLLDVDKNELFLDDDIYERDRENHPNKNEMIVNKKKRSNNIFTKKNNNVYENLRAQLCNLKLTEDEFIVSDFIIWNIDEEGYLRREFNELINDISFFIKQRVEIHKIEKLVEIIKKLEPIGIGSSNLKECLLIQLEHKPISTNILTAKLIINNNFDLLCRKQYKKIKENLKLNYKELHSAINEIKCLNPKPGKIYDETYIFDTIQIVPDFFLRIEEGLFELYLNKRNTRKLFINPYYIEMLRRFQENYLPNKKNIVFIRKKLEKAKWVIDAINQRRETLLFTMKAILKFQKEYFFSGEKQKIRPMTLKNIAEYIHIEISTVSRVINKKYIETPYETLLLKDLFSEKIIYTFGEEVSNIEVKDIISNIIKKEDRKYPFTDEKISLILKKKGYNIARRTITKYRKQLHIPIARLRKIIS